MSGNDILILIILVFCILLSAFFSSAETAFISLNKYHLEHMIASDVKGAKKVAQLLNRPERFLSTVLFGSNLANTAATALATVLAISFWGTGSGTIIATISMTVIILIFGDTTPKSIAARHSERLTLSFTRPIEIVYWIFSPFVLLLSWISLLFTRLVRGTPLPSSFISDEEIRTLISVGQKEGTVEDSEARLLDGVFNFGDRPVSEIMVPRLEVISIEQGSKISDFLELFSKHPFSRFPVFQENMDKMVGILSLKDVLMGIAQNSLNKDSLIDEIIRPAYFTPETKRISELFEEMQKNNYHIAVVIDEFGGTAGIATLSRMMEEIVGPIGDELAAVEKDYATINESTFQVDGGMRIETANEELGLELPGGKYETVAGFVLSRLGHIPKPGEGLRFKNLKLLVTRMRGRKIDEILLTIEATNKEDNATVTH
jgi:putative hemolysin